jgi:hypothetical protein
MFEKIMSRQENEDRNGKGGNGPHIRKSKQLW